MKKIISILIGLMLPITAYGAYPNNVPLVGGGGSFIKATSTTGIFDSLIATSSAATSTLKNTSVNQLKVGSLNGVLTALTGFLGATSLSTDQILVGASSGFTTATANSASGWVKLDSNGNINGYALIPTMSSSSDIITRVADEGEMMWATGTQPTLRIGESTVGGGYAGGFIINPWDFASSTGNINYSRGSVSVGSTTPFANLSVVGSGSAAAVMAIYGTTLADNSGQSVIIKGGNGAGTLGANGADLSFFGGDSTQAGINAGNGGNVYIAGGKSYLAGTSNVVLQADSSGVIKGNVGIGTTTPSSRLSVVGGAYIGGNTFNAGTITSTSTASSTLPQLASTGFSTTWLCLTGDTCRTTWPTGSGGTDPFSHTTSFGTTASATSTLTQFTGGLSASSTIRFGNAAINGTSNIGSGLVFDSTKSTLGIGTTTSVVSPLDVRQVLTLSNAPDGSAYVEQVHSINDTPYLAGFFNDHFSTTTPEFQYFGRSSIGQGLIAGDFQMGTAASTTPNSLALFTNGFANTRLLVAGGGNIGIATTSPWGLLSVNPNGIGAEPEFAVGSSTKTDFLVNNNGNVGVGTSSPATTLAVGGSGYVTAGLGVGILNTTSGTIQSTGNISTLGSLGVGINNPSAPIDVQASDATLFVKATNASNFSGMNMYDNNGTLAASFQYGNASACCSLNNTMFMGTRIANAPLEFLTGGLNVRDTIDASGNFGHATTSPFGFFSIAQSTETNSLWIGHQGSTTPSLVIKGTNGNGNIGLATTSPWRTLSVTGTAAINGLSSALGKDSVCVDPTTKELVDSGSTTCSGISSKKIKHDITEISAEEAKKILLELNPVSFTYNDSGERRVGFVADEVVKADPRLVEFATKDTNFPKASGTIKKGEPIAVEYANITSLLTKSFQTLWTTTQNLIARVSGLENRLNTDEKRMDEQDQRIKALEAKLK